MINTWIQPPYWKKNTGFKRNLPRKPVYDVDVRKYTELCHKIVINAAKKYGLTLKYGQRKGGEIEPMVPRPEGL
uniref:Uncharacterized protein n=1 Tax=Candidatus Kentrum sp. MB TaxID=2138164 RepID=A0A450XMG3_9GAMM|nr:MAG: hypothetical protein BECKMB1821G_GA0114241_10655 [Candidatus Kentron sp. MB]VFK34424.1 MAG: hypothetical protein BECKMB1821I_GA0114274_107117 [Candidatus Kentron sp. MB]VFK76701.1 MAG: hypothetical protein BECKMB1821H_GA0114242_10705 [Candidatus Kentron sp. MB]